MKRTSKVVAVAALGLVVACSGGEKAQEAKKAAPKVEAPKVEAPAEPAGEPGGIKVIVKYDGDAPARAKVDRSADPYCAKTEELSGEVIVNADGTLANTAVFLKKVRGKSKAPEAAVKLEQNDCAYSPRVQTAHKGQKISITNGDKTLHNVHSYKGAKKKNWFNVAQPPGAPAKLEKLKKAELATFKCDVHPWMASYVVAVNHRFHGTTGNEGTVVLEDVPSKGKPYKLITWHEKFGEQETEVLVKGGEVATVTVTYSGNGG